MERARRRPEQRDPSRSRMAPPPADRRATTDGLRCRGMGGRRAGGARGHPGPHGAHPLTDALDRLDLPDREATDTQCEPESQGDARRGGVPWRRLPESSEYVLRVTGVQWPAKLQHANDDSHGHSTTQHIGQRQEGPHGRQDRPGRQEPRAPRRKGQVGRRRRSGGARFTARAQEPPTSVQAACRTLRVTTTERQQMTVTSPRVATPLAGHALAGLGRRARTDAVVRLLALSALWLSLLLVTYWWVADGGLQDLTGWATGLTSSGGISGLVGLGAAPGPGHADGTGPALERAFGQDRLARVHRLVGFTSFNLMLLHIVTITWGYAVGRLLSTPATLWDLTVHYPGMLLAAAGTACLFMVVLTSVKAARRRLRYESWHLMHLYAYLGVGLALPHQLWTGPAVHRLPREDRLLVDRVGGCRRHGPGVPRRTPGAAEPAPPAPGDLGRRRGRRNLVGPPRGQAPRPTAGRGRAVPHLALPRPCRLDPRQPLLPVGCTRRTQPAHHRAGGRRRQRQPRAGFGPGTRALVEGPYGRLSARTRTRPRVALIGAGVGITPLARSGRGTGLRARRGDPGRALHPTAAVRPRGRPPRRGRGLQVLRLPGHRRSAGLVARRRHRPGRRPDRAALLDPRHRRARRLRLRSPSLDRPGLPHSRSPPASPPTTSISRPLRGDPMRRITLWVLSTLSALVLLFGYSTSTSGPQATRAPSSIYSSSTLRSLQRPGRPAAPVHPSLPPIPRPPGRAPPATRASPGPSPRRSGVPSRSSSR